MDPGSTTDLLAVALTLGRGQTLTQGTWSKTPGKLWKVGGTAEEGARENPAFPPFLHLAAASIRRCCTCVPGVSDQMPERRCPPACRPILPAVTPGHGC